MEHNVPFLDSFVLAIGFLGIIYIIGYLLLAKK